MSIASPLSFYLIAEKPPNALTALVNGTLSDPFMSIPYDTGSAGSITPLPGMSVWFGSTSGGQERGVLRLRSWNGSNQISVAESDDVGPFIQNNDFITIKAQWRLWPKYPRALIQGDSALLLEDYDVSFVDQTLRWLPVAVAGPPSVTEYNGATFQARFVGDRSFALASGATISSYLWTAPGSVEGTSTSQGTEGSPVIFTWTSAGQKLVYLRVTDSNGKQHTNYTWAFGVDPNNPDTVAYTDFDTYNDNFDFEQGGGSCSFTVHGSATIADFPNEAMVVMASRPTTPGQTTPTGYWPNRDNVHFVGYVLGNTVRQNPVSGDVSFQAATIDSLMKNLTMFPVSLTYTAAPQNWTQAADLTPDRAAAFLWHYHSTLSTMTPIVRTGYGALIYRQDFGPGDLYSQLDSELLKTMWGKVVSNHQGVLHHLIDYNLMINSERSTVTVRKTLHKGVWVDDLSIEERHAYANPVNVVKASGVIYTGGSIEDVCPSFSEAPGNAPKVYGKEMSYDRLILDSQTNLNIRTGRALAKHTTRYPNINASFINDGSFTIAPQELFTSNVEASDNNRGLALTTRLLPRSISRTFDNGGGHISYSVGFEPETDGPPGVTVDLPCGPPAQVYSGVPVPVLPAEAFSPLIPGFGYFPGGVVSGAETANTDRITFSTGITAAHLNANMTNAKNSVGCVSDRMLYGYYCGGNASGSFFDDTDRLELGTGVSAAYPTAVLSVTDAGFFNLSAAADGYGYFPVGSVTNGLSANRLNYSTGAMGNYPAAYLSTVRGVGSSLSNGTTAGYCLGGIDTVNYAATCDKLTFANGVMAAFATGNLVQARAYAGAVFAGATYGYIAGGEDGIGTKSTAERFNISTEVCALNAVSDLPTARTLLSAASDGIAFGYFVVDNFGARIVFSTGVTSVYANAVMSQVKSRAGGFSDGAA